MLVALVRHGHHRPRTMTSGHREARASARVMPAQACQTNTHHLHHAPLLRSRRTRCVRCCCYHGTRHVRCCCYYHRTRCARRCCRPCHRYHSCPCRYGDGQHAHALSCSSSSCLPNAQVTATMEKVSVEDVRPVPRMYAVFLGGASSSDASRSQNHFISLHLSTE